MMSSRPFQDDAGRRRFFHSSLHVVQIVCQGNNREEDRKSTTQRNNALAAAWAARMSRLRLCETAGEQGIAPHGSDEPHQVKGEFHNPQSKPAQIAMLRTSNARGPLNKALEKIASNLRHLLQWSQRYHFNIWAQVISSKI